MAFEAFVASGAAGRDRPLRVGVAVSLALHLPPLVLFAMQLVVRPTLTERTESVSALGADRVVPVRITGLWVPHREAPSVAALRVTAPSAASPAPAEKAVHRAKQLPPRPSRARVEQPHPAPVAAAPKLRLPEGGEAIVAEAERHAAVEAVPAPPPSESDLERRAAAVGTAMLAGLSANSVAPAALSLSSGPYTGGDSGPRAAPTHELTSGAAAYLRTYETFPTLPDGSWGWTKRTYVFLMKVCVAESGQVDEVIIQRGSRPDLDAYLAAAIRTWRYRPWMVSGSPRPFCHPLRITYSRG